MKFLSWYFAHKSGGEKAMTQKREKGSEPLKLRVIYGPDCAILWRRRWFWKGWWGGGWGDMWYDFLKRGARTHFTDTCSRRGPSELSAQVNSASLNNREGEQKTSMKADLYLNSRYCVRDLYLTPESGGFFFVFSEGPYRSSGWGGGGGVEGWRGGWSEPRRGC